MVKLLPLREEVTHRKRDVTPPEVLAEPGRGKVIAPPIPALFCFSWTSSFHSVNLFSFFFLLFGWIWPASGWPPAQPVISPSSATQHSPTTHSLPCSLAEKCRARVGRQKDLALRKVSKEDTDLAQQRIWWDNSRHCYQHCAGLGREHEWKENSQGAGPERGLGFLFSVSTAVLECRTTHLHHMSTPPSASRRKNAAISIFPSKHYSLFQAVRNRASTVGGRP